MKSHTVSRILKYENRLQFEIFTSLHKFLLFKTKKRRVCYKKLT